MQRKILSLDSVDGLKFHTTLILIDFFIQQSFIDFILQNVCWLLRAKIKYWNIFIKSTFSQIKLKFYSTGFTIRLIRSEQSCPNFIFYQTYVINATFLFHKLKLWIVINDFFLLKSCNKNKCNWKIFKIRLIQRKTMLKFSAIVTFHHFHHSTD